MSRRSAPEINAGSMADIAFLLLIFFLVTTTIESDKGITRRLPPIDEQEPEDVVVKERNVFEVVISRNGDLLVEDKPMELKDLREAALNFIDNGGGTGSAACPYCQGAEDPKSSENPQKAVISLEYARQTKYGDFIAVQNELMGAFNQLRDRVSLSEFGVPFSKLQEDMDKAANDIEKDEIAQKITRIREFYPLNIMETKPEQVN
ncbi:MAG TPA: biopolymer transporter ExbD [Flavobacteriaceae bacterium]|nr:biopolymer transporter ExbD [Flavobacteriaceae bacterium]